LRKLNNLETIKIESPVNSVKFDHSGNYFVIGSNDISIYQTKPLNNIIKITDHKKSVTQVAFGKDCQFVCSSSLDRYIKIFSGTKKN